MTNQEPVKIKIHFPTVDPILTYIILGLLTLVYIYQSRLDIVQQDAFLMDWAKINSLIYEGQYYRLISSMFVHLEMLHFFFNAYALYLFGRDVERLFGHLRFAIIYFLGGLAGSVASLIYTDAPSIGASGAIFAVFAAMGVYYYHHQRLYGEIARQRLIQMGVLAIINIMFGMLPDVRIDNAAHIGGLIGGFILAWFISPEYEIMGRETMQPRLEDTNPSQNWFFVPVAFTIAIAIIVMMFSVNAS